MEYLNIIEENFTKSDYVAYLRGSILMWLLEDKPFYTAQFKLYADKLVEVLEEQSTDTTDEECHCLQTQAPEPTVDPDEPRVIKPFKFKLGDHVIISKGTEDERTGVIVRLPMEGVDCNNAWVASGKIMELLQELIYEAPEFLNQIDEKLVNVDEYYHTKDYIYECNDGRYFCLTVTQHSSMGDFESAYFYEVFPKEVTTVEYVTKEDL